MRSYEVQLGAIRTNEARLGAIRSNEAQLGVMRSNEAQLGAMRGSEELVRNSHPELRIPQRIPHYFLIFPN